LTNTFLNKAITRKLMIIIQNHKFKAHVFQLNKMEPNWSA